MGSKDDTHVFYYDYRLFSVAARDHHPGTDRPFLATPLIYGKNSKFSYLKNSDENLLRSLSTKMMITSTHTLYQPKLIFIKQIVLDL